MKLAIVLIFSFFSRSLFAECTRAIHFSSVKLAWEKITSAYGDTPLPKEIFICIGRNYFFEIPRGSTMRSVLDRKNKRILLRKTSMHDLTHELLHLYLDLRWQVLPYSISEPFVVAMNNFNSCPNIHEIKSSLPERWQRRKEIDTCGVKNLIIDILQASTDERKKIPLQ
ncbi:MAG TPA: hypothetical protein PLY93_06125 [Turneriella sp.]|nr:hypothetical protein [Turneriella sp.]